MGGFDRSLRAVALSRLVGQRLRMLKPPRQDDLQTLREFIEAGKVTPVVDRTFPLPETPEAIRHLLRELRPRQDRHHRLSGTSPATHFGWRLVAAIIRHMLRDEAEERSLDRVGRWRRLDSPGWGRLTAAVVLVFVALRLVANGEDLSAFVVAGDRFVDPRTAPAELTVHEDSSGYDGAFVYRLALDPFTDQQVAHGITLDNPPYRQQRIGLPVVSWLVAAATPLPTAADPDPGQRPGPGRGRVVRGRFARAYGRHASLGVLLAVLPGVLIGLARDLNEPLAWLGLLAGLWWWREERYPLAVVAFGGRPDPRDHPGGGGRHRRLAAGRARPGRAPGAAAAGRRVLWLLVPLACALAWQGWLYGSGAAAHPLRAGQHRGAAVPHGDLAARPRRRLARHRAGRAAEPSLAGGAAVAAGPWRSSPGRCRAPAFPGDAARLGLRPAAAGAGAGLGARRAVLPGRDRGDRGRAAAAGPPRPQTRAAAGRDRGHGGRGRGRPRACL